MSNRKLFYLLRFPQFFELYLSFEGEITALQTKSKVAAAAHDIFTKLCAGVQTPDIISFAQKTITDAHKTLTSGRGDFCSKVSKTDNFMLLVFETLLQELFVATDLAYPTQRHDGETFVGPAGTPNTVSSKQIDQLVVVKEYADNIKTLEKWTIQIVEAYIATKRDVTAMFTIVLRQIIRGTPLTDDATLRTAMQSIKDEEARLVQARHPVVVASRSGVDATRYAAVPYNVAGKALAFGAQDVVSRLDVLSQSGWAVVNYVQYYVQGNPIPNADVVRLSVLNRPRTKQPSRQNVSLGDDAWLFNVRRDQTARLYTAFPFLAYTVACVTPAVLQTVIDECGIEGGRLQNGQFIYNTDPTQVRLELPSALVLENIPAVVSLGGTPEATARQAQAVAGHPAVKTNLVPIMLLRPDDRYVHLQLQTRNRKVLALGFASLQTPIETLGAGIHGLHQLDSNESGMFVPHEISIRLVTQRTNNTLTVKQSPLNAYFVPFANPHKVTLEDWIKFQCGPRDLSRIVQHFSSTLQEVLQPNFTTQCSVIITGDITRFPRIVVPGEIDTSYPLPLEDDGDVTIIATVPV